MPLHSYPPGARHSRGFVYYGIDVITLAITAAVIVWFPASRVTPSRPGDRALYALSTPSGGGDIRDKAMQGAHFLVSDVAVRLRWRGPHHDQEWQVSSSSFHDAAFPHVLSTRGSRSSRYLCLPPGALIECSLKHYGIDTPGTQAHGTVGNATVASTIYGLDPAAGPWALLVRPS